ncbi:NUDIX hydrolase, partial [Vibrio parahaemolyticus]
MKDLSMAVVVKQGKVLVQNRYRSGKGMVFEFPGGSVD